MESAPVDSPPAAPRGRVSTASHGRILLVALVLFAITAIVEWRWYVEGHESIYLMGPHRVHDPSFLASDFTWKTLPPTAFIYDHLLAPLWPMLGDFGIATLGRFVTWAFTAWAVAAIAGALAIPWWSTIPGFAFWMLTGQRVFYCGSPIEGFQPKALAYPFLFFGIADALRGRFTRAGVLCGIGTVLHVVVGGWGFLGIVGAMLLSRRPLRDLARFGLAAAPFLAVVVVMLHGLGEGTAAEVAAMNRIYVTFAAPHCCDPKAFADWALVVYAAVMFPVAALMLHLWPRSTSGHLAGNFVIALVVFFVLGLVARPLEIFGFLKLYPFQLANALPAMLLAITLPAWLLELRRGRWPGRILVVVAMGLAVAAWIAQEVDFNIAEIPYHIARPDPDPERTPRFGDRAGPLEVYDWIRRETPRDAIFITPFLPEFWVCAERAQVASLRHPPFDRRLIEWMRRLEAINGSRPFELMGFRSADTLSAREALLTPAQLAALRDSCGATHYMASGVRPDLDSLEIHSSGKWHVYDLARLNLGSDHRNGR